MTKEDVRIILSSATGKNVYIQASISRTLARKIETLLEENHVVIISPYSEKWSAIISRKME
jgi:hypothetical protein